jgi:hypothetical protein
MIPVRCGHGIYRSRVKCEWCDRAGVAAPPAEAVAPLERRCLEKPPEERHVAFLNEVGKTLGGATVLREAGTSNGTVQWVVVFPCGHERVVAGVRLRRAERKHERLVCGGCPRVRRKGGPVG